MNQPITLSNLNIHPELYDFIDQKVIPTTTFTTEEFFTKLAHIASTLADDQQHLLAKRYEFEQQINDWHNTHLYTKESYKTFLTDIGYLEPEIADFKINVNGVDEEIKHIAGPQLVVPISNARFAINALNARYGSLYDALYGSNIIPDSGDTAKGASYNPARGQAVIQWSAEFLDEILPLVSGTYSEVSEVILTDDDVQFTTKHGTTTLKDTSNYQGMRTTLEGIELLFTHHNLHVILVIIHGVIKDVLLESAVTTIVDFEDSVATVSASEKVRAYENLLGLIDRSLTTSFTKGNQTIERTLEPNKVFISPSKEEVKVRTTSLMLIRNVGHHMMTELVTDSQGNPIPEGILDACITCLISCADLTSRQNSREGSIYIVKPKMHGSKEVALTNTLMTLVEQALDMPKHTIKIGIMDEEKRTSTNLKQCIHAAKERVIFINTGFLDRTGDEIHTCMHAGAVLPKAEIKSCAWIKAYESLNVTTALHAGFSGNAQIGKGMWAEPDNMQTMLEAKIAHLHMGANCSWVPSPTAATIHATHYHRVNIFTTHEALIGESANHDDLLELPLLGRTLTQEEITAELRNNAQGILGYVSRWIMMGIGCSKVEDINNIALMEDRATLRISSQHIANWLHHHICTKEQVEEVFKEMATLVDEQNAHDPAYTPMTNNYDSPAYRAALALVFNGASEPNGYTEFTLNKYRGLELG